MQPYVLLTIILGAKTVHLAILGVLRECFLKSIDMCKRVHAHWCFSLDQKCIFEVYLSIIPTSYVVMHIMEQFCTTQTEFFPIKLMCYINRPDYAAAANGCSVRGTRLELDPCPCICSVDADSQR